METLHFAKSVTLFNLKMLFIRWEFNIVSSLLSERNNLKNYGIGYSLFVTGSI